MCVLCVCVCLGEHVNATVYMLRTTLWSYFISSGFTWIFCDWIQVNRLAQMSAFTWWVISLINAFSLILYLCNLTHTGARPVHFNFVGSLYPDGSFGYMKADDSVPPGGIHVYNWTIPEGHAPTAADPACLTWIYHSHVDAPRDIAAGLIGPLITCKRGTYPDNHTRCNLVHLWEAVR